MSEKFVIISKPSELDRWCSEHIGTAWIGLDTEFIAERYYQPHLCLIQAATPNGNFLIDPIQDQLNVTPFWEFLVNGDHETIVHSGRFEMEFCWRAANRLPKRVFDTQVAAGLVSNEYPAGYSNIVSHFLNIQMPGTESRTNWKTRPLTARQLEYAVDDIAYLHPVREVLYSKMEERNRLGWFACEMKSRLESILQLLSPERWQRILTGTHWTPRELAIVHSLWQWREAVAQKRDCSARHVLRDDLLLEMARRKTADVRSIRNIRGMERSDLRPYLHEISVLIESAIRLHEKDCPKVEFPHHCAKLSVLGTLLYSVLGTICHQHELAPGLVGTQTDVRDWAAWRLRTPGYTEKYPHLANGWRAEIVGDIFDALLSGKKMIRITDPMENFPIEFIGADELKKENTR
ncbi:MAG: hypothetical protein E7029_04455 [Planctomycetaceae bacterium]|nr:hypothetical protein [Planctomycetaceae bacterium]